MRPQWSNIHATFPMLPARKSTRTSDVDDPVASERGTEGTNYPHGVGDHPDSDAWDYDMK